MEPKVQAKVEAPASRGKLVLGVHRTDSKYSTALPREYYVSEDIYQQEVDKVFSKHWTFDGRVSEILKVGDYFVHDFAGESIVVVREATDKISGYLNVCRHRGHKLCVGPAGNIRKFVCPYHYWAYGLDGNLSVAP